ncbi:patatin-like phospholipase family protein [Variovorax paradoxus]|uniref:patatin-like phospholipase family protein n=1 Tax=Variovorax paradoxus TaxID=34073 RepID=UPI003D65A423
MRSPFALASTAVRLACACMASALLLGCSAARPWINAPVRNSAPAPLPLLMQAQPQHAEAVQERPIVAAVALSGGGARAAAFGLGVLQELKATQLEIGGRKTTLLDEVGLVSGVSGGSILAGYYAAFGDEVFTRFEKDFLLVNFQNGLLRQALYPSTFYRLTSPWWGRGNVLQERLDAVFRSATYGQLRTRRPWPRLLVTATDLTTGVPFEFTPEQFALICSDLDSVPLSFAVAASSSVPLLLSPMTLRNHAGSCDRPAQEQQPPVNADRNLSARMLHLIAQSYSNAADRPYLHLVDGGLVDNLGVRGLVDHAAAGGSLRESFRHLPPGSVRKIVLVSVNSERDIGERLDDTDRVPSTGQVLSALVFGAGSRYTKETIEIVQDTARRAAAELATERGRDGSPFAADAELHLINVSLHDVPDAGLRRASLRVPTSFEILPVHSHQLVAGGRSALRESPQFQQLLRSLGGPGKAAGLVASDAAGQR